MDGEKGWFARIHTCAKQDCVELGRIFVCHITNELASILLLLLTRQMKERGKHNHTRLIWRKLNTR